MDLRTEADLLRRWPATAASGAAIEAVGMLKDNFWKLRPGSLGTPPK